MPLPLLAECLLSGFLHDSITPRDVHLAPYLMGHVSSGVSPWIQFLQVYLYTYNLKVYDLFMLESGAHLRPDRLPL